MELWEKVILEWINCLKVQEKPVTNITELQDGEFYINFLKLIKWKKLENFDQEDIMKFIKEEYPTFKVNKDDDAEHIYIASLLLLHLCRPLFAIHYSLQYNMCDNLRNETQIRVKAFLESVLPIGKDITKETMREVIMEVEDSSIADGHRTPPLENFPNSPLTCSGRSKKILTERVRELRDLKCSLAIERFTNSDLRDDISRQHNKIKKLQEKLEEKSAKIKELQEERIKSNTPQPSRTRKDNSQEDYYKRYINDLENQLSKQQDEIDKLETEKDAISKELCCMRRTSKHYKENFSNCERSLESLSNKIELKDRELIELRMHNEELRAHMKELNKNANPEQSFEVEDISFLATKSLNNSEVLSTVIEIQLQEAKEESAILHAQVDSLKGRLDILTKDYRNTMESNRDLHEKVKILDRVQTELNHMQKTLDISNTTITNLRMENTSLVTQTEDLKSLLSSKEKKLFEIEQSNVALQKELDVSNTTTANLQMENISLVTQTEDFKSLLSTKEKRMSEIEQSNVTLQKELDVSNTTIANLQMENTSLVTQTEDLKSLLLTKEKKMSKIEQSNVTLQKELDVSNTTVANLQMENTSLVTQTEDLKSLLSSEEKKLSEIEQSNVALQKELDVSNTTTANLQMENISLVTQTEDFKSLLSTKEKRMSEIEQSNVTLQKELDVSNTTIANLQMENTSLVTQTEDLKSLLSSKEKKLSEIEQSNVALQKELDVSNTTVVNLQMENISLVTQTEDFKSLLSTKEKRMSEIEQSNVALQKELDVSNTTVVNLQMKNTSLITQTEDLKSLLSSKEKRFFEIEESNVALSTELNNLKLDMKNLNELLENEKTNSSNLSATLTKTKSQITEYLVCIHKLTDERNSYKCSIENCSKNLKDILHCDNQFIQIEINNLNNSTLSDLIKYIETILHNYNVMRTSYESDIKKLNTTIDEINTNVLKQQLTITTLEEQNKQTVLELAVIEEEKKQKDLLLNEQEEIMHTYSQEIKILEKIRDEKFVLEQNVHELTNNLTNQELLLKYVMTQLENLQNINKDFKLIKEETQQNFDEYKKNIEVIFKKLQYEYHTLYHNYHKVQQEKEKLEYDFNRNKEELSKIQAINATLQQNLLENEEKTGTLEKKKRILFDELNESKRNVQELKDINKVLEELYAVMKTETNDKLESLKSDNAKILLELKDATDKLNLLHQEMNDTMTQMELKEAQINELLSDVSVLKTEKDDLIRSHKETLEAKNKEIEMKGEALVTLQTKMDKLVSEANTTEKKMKEIIINLQEIRSSQGAVLTTQEAALKEKCLYIEELQERFDNSKKILNKELEDAKSSLREYQSKFFDLENQFNNQNKTIAELQDTLKTMSTELETSKEYCKYMDANQAEIVKLCQELEHPTKNLNTTITESCSDFNLHVPQCIDIENKYNCINLNNNTNILNIIKMTLDELHKSQKIISHLSCANTELNETLAKQKILTENSVKDKEEVCSLKNKIRELEIIAQKRNNYLKSLIKNKESLKDSLQKVFAVRNDLDTSLTSSKQKWNEILTKFQNIFYTESFVCDEFKRLQLKKTNLENILFKCQVDYSENIKSICDILWKKFLWTEQKLHDTYLCSIHEKECLDILTSVEEDQFSNEKVIIDTELEKYKTLQIDVIKSEEEIESFSALAISFDNSLKSGEIKNQVEIEKKLQNQINQLTKEKKDLKTRMDTMRLRNVKLEKNIDDLRTEMKKLKSETETVLTDTNLTVSEGVQSLKEELERLKEQNQLLHGEKDESNKMTQQKFENQLKEIHATYEQKLEDMKQKMKTAYNEQMTKLNKDQEKIVQEKLQNQMEIMCQKQREELNRYKAHVGELSSQLWSVGEKLLIEQQQKQDTLQRLKELETKIKEVQVDQPMATISRKTCKVEKQEMLPAHKITTLITEETLERRHSIRSIQAMGNVFKTEDEEEIFDNVYLADMKRGNLIPAVDANRLSVLQMRNSLCKPHLKSSYPAEMQFLPLTLTEEEIKTGSSVEDNFNDSLSQSLLPEQKARKKDRSQISYKKPGPPTPSKNGGRLSLQGNELKSPSSRVLRERNMDKRTTTTPHSLKNIFSLKRQDENTTSTPKGRRLSSLFRKSRLQSDR